MPLEVYGADFQPWLEDYEVDRLGVSKVVICQRWANRPPNVRQAPLQFLPEPLPFVRFLSGQSGPVAYGVARWFFEGAGPDANLNEGGTVNEYEFDGTFNQEPIESHPDWRWLRDTFGGSLANGQVSWLEELPRSAENASRGLKLRRTESGARRNPLLGTESYLALGAIWTVTYAARALPGNLNDDLGLIVDRPRGNPPTPRDRNWLQMAPRGRKRGNVVQISDRWMLSGIGGWVKPVYGRRLYT